MVLACFFFDIFVWPMLSIPEKTLVLLFVAYEHSVDAHLNIFWSWEARQ